MTTVDPSTEARTDGWARRRERVACHIERAALELIAAKGPDSVTVEEMAEAAGISVRTFFRYFRSREEVMSALPNRSNRALAARVAARPSSEGVLEAFIAAVRESQLTAAAAGQDIPYGEELLFLWGKARQHWPIDSPGAEMIAAYAEVIAERIGAPVADAGVEIMATAIANVVWVAFRRWLGAGGEKPFSVVVEESFTVLAQLNERRGKPASRKARTSR
jgi:AcrR family transcriptional regulator